MRTWWLYAEERGIEGWKSANSGGEGGKVDGCLERPVLYLDLKIWLAGSVPD